MHTSFGIYVHITWHTWRRERSLRRQDVSRVTGAILDAAADAGWSLERLIEQPHHEYVAQAGIPRLLACRWRLLP